ncbi:LOW QUALITY PROTEIN: facilitated trehalose transporter Tret1-like [Bacillus rossius redtenbacheri]|uniref:LOW QUALITY PROTEIN: facilitated trehalose transporter Tret1-like n=1 Tax=Bacillus rossius redtenbacheri TaxID=93214 RepID=UPI002FDD0F85
MGTDAANEERDGSLEADPMLEHGGGAARPEAAKEDPLLPPPPVLGAGDRPSEAADEDCSPHEAKALRAQLLVAGGVFLLGVAAGFPIGFSAVLLPQLQAPGSSLPTDDDMASWIASIHSAATPVGSLLSGLVADRFGRRLALQAAALPYAAGWVVMALARSHAAVIAARVVCGFSVGLTAAPAQIILGEVAEPRVRGMLSGTPFISYSLGILLVYALGASLPWRLASWLATAVPLLALLVFCFLPESPVWLARRGRVEGARRALLTLRGGDATKVKQELAELLRQLPPDNGRRSSLHNIASSQNSIGLLGSQKILSSIKNTIARPRALGAYLEPHNLKPFLIVLAFGLSQAVCGTYMVIFYAVDLVSKAGPGGGGRAATLRPVRHAVLTAIVRLAFVCLASGLMFSVGRRPLALASGCASAMTALALGVLLSGEPSPWVVAVLLQVFVAANTVGFFILPGVCIGELLPASVRGSAGGVIFMLFNLCLFGMAKVFPAMSRSMGGHGLFWFFSACTALTTVFLYLFLPETRNKTLQEVEYYFRQDNILWRPPQKGKPAKAAAVC